MTLAHDRRGSGDPLVLIHGIGSHRHVWAPVVPLLQSRREVLAVDLPGFGDSAPLPAGTVPSPAALTDAVEAFLDLLSLDRPDVAGNSLGGWIALELAKRGRARAATALSPAGFWNARERAYAIASLRNAHAAALALGPRIDGLARSAAFRGAASWQLAAHGSRQTPEAYAAAIRNLAASPGWEATLDAMRHEHFTGGAAVPAGTTVAWADKDRLLLPRQAERARRALPLARHVRLRDCGHVPTWDDPEQVAEVVLAA